MKVIWFGSIFMEGERWVRDMESIGEIREESNMLEIDGVRAMRYLF